MSYTVKIELVEIKCLDEGSDAGDGLEIYGKLWSNAGSHDRRTMWDVAANNAVDISAGSAYSIEKSEIYTVASLPVRVYAGGNLREHDTNNPNDDLGTSEGETTLSIEDLDREPKPIKVPDFEESQQRASAQFRARLLSVK